MFISNFDIFAGSVHSDFGNATQGFGNKEEESPIPLESWLYSFEWEILKWCLIHLMNHRTPDRADNYIGLGPQLFIKSSTLRN